MFVMLDMVKHVQQPMTDVTLIVKGGTVHTDTMADLEFRAPVRSIRMPFLMILPTLCKSNKSQLRIIIARGQGSDRLWNCPIESIMNKKRGGNMTKHFLHSRLHPAFPRA